MLTIKDTNAPATKKFYKAFDNITPHYNDINTAHDIGLNGLGEKDKDQAYKLLNYSRLSYALNKRFYKDRLTKTSLYRNFSSNFSLSQEY